MDLPKREPETSSRGSRLVRPETTLLLKNARIRLLGRARKMRLAWRLILIALLCCLAAIIWLNQTSTIVSVGYDLDKIEKQEALLNQQAEAMNTEIGHYTSLRQIDQEARDKLGMVEATKFVYLDIPSAPDSATNGTNTNPYLYQISDWWRILSQMLPSPWKDALPVRPR